jgi:hypothetical protein
MKPLKKIQCDNNFDPSNVFSPRYRVKLLPPQVHFMSFVKYKPAQVRAPLAHEKKEAHLS